MRMSRSGRRANRGLSTGTPNVAAKSFSRPHSSFSPSRASHGGILTTPSPAHMTPLQAPSRPAACSCFIACSDPSIHARPSNTSSSRSSSSTT
ncbi:hypothetical protein J010_02465 [Cryptococcus neoformans]|nr:hypothetical protein C355_02388 [Cryptococcus neoformans var. grubii Th84]OXH13061.1 hypothetical protein J010_02465 [Cryptococcus neoformans var. grubii]OXH33841.1 hypothetical protein J009_02479 [Cryptococcus neoformans var. grubii]OXH54360.1 hypothetical protein J003_02457 [Cryptococcus neoformans var. grubii]OXH58077.1 hypothetical protein J002_02458 [Cryptococcus neoformans var. grubii]